MDYADITTRLLPIVEKAAAFIRQHAGKVRDADVETKSHNSLVSYVDKTAEEILVSGLQHLLPESGFITEEETIAPQTQAYTWIIDPLDGTTNFLQQIPMYSVSVALKHHDEIVIGVVSDVAHGEVFYAWKHGGAWCNGQRIHVSSKSQLRDAVVATGFPYTADKVLPEIVQVFEYYLKNARGMRRLGSAALDLAYVACGRFDMYYESALNAWDIAGGIIIVTEAGGTVTDFTGGNTMLECGRLISSNQHVHDEVLGVFSSFFSS